MHSLNYVFKRLNSKYVCRGVLQSLVEKHFPAPDRHRIHRLLGIDTKKMRHEASHNGNMSSEPGSSSGKRKSGLLVC